MSDSWQAIDRNSRGSLTAVSNVDDKTIVRLVADPVTGALLVSTVSILSAAWFNETPTGTIDGINTVFVLSETPAANSLVLTLARQPQILGDDYSISGSTITYLVAPDASLSGQPHNAIYAVTGGTIPGTVFTAIPSGLINGSNTTYTVPSTITTVINFVLNGEAITPDQYSTSGNTITFITALPSAFAGTPFYITYI